MVATAEALGSFRFHETVPTPLDSLQLVRHYGEIVGNSPALREALERLEAVATTPTTTLVLGESGVGKELIARAVHRLSRRSDKPLVKVNCASIPHELFESEFFGHVRGSFTGAHRDRAGRFELANSGTLFLDEVSEIPLELQAKLLRVIQEGQFERVGDAKTRSVDVRIVAASNRNLWQSVSDGLFREDLYYRLSVFPISVPPLRERGDDVLALATHFLAENCAKLGCNPMFIDDRDARLLQAYDWPGNVRELCNVIERAVILSMGGPLNLRGAIPTRPVFGELRPQGLPNDEGGFVRESDWQRSYRKNIIAALEASSWRISGDGGAADLLGINASTLRGRMKSLKIRMPRDSVTN